MFLTRGPGCPPALRLQTSMRNSSLSTCPPTSSHLPSISQRHQLFFQSSRPHNRNSALTTPPPLTIPSFSEPTPGDLWDPVNSTSQSPSIVTTIAFGLTPFSSYLDYFNEIINVFPLFRPLFQQFIHQTPTLTCSKHLDVAELSA